MKDIQDAVLDIETSSLAADSGHILCAVLRPFEGEPIGFRIDDYKDFKKNMSDDSKLCDDLAQALKRCVRVYSWYGTRFDIPFIKTRRFVINEQALDTTFLHMDAWGAVRHFFKMHNNRLASYMGVFNTEAEKTSISPVVWESAQFGNREDMDYIYDHCLADTSGTVDVIKRLQKALIFKNFKLETI